MKEYTYLFKNNETVHNIPEDKILDIHKLDIITRSTYNAFNRLRTDELLSKSTFQELQDNGYVFWCTENLSDDQGLLFIKNDSGQVVVARVSSYFKGYDSTDMVRLIPVIKFSPSGYCWESWPSRNVKIFETKEDLNAHAVKLEQKRKAVNKKYDQAIEEINKEGVEITLSTGKVRVVKVLKKTKKLECKVGDIIEGKIRLIQRDSVSNRFVTAIYGGNSYSNYITAYVNGECIKSVPPTMFADMFIENYVVENVTE